MCPVLSLDVVTDHHRGTYCPHVYVTHPSALLFLVVYLKHFFSQSTCVCSVQQNAVIIYVIHYLKLHK